MHFSPSVGREAWGRGGCCRQKQEWGLEEQDFRASCVEEVQCLPSPKSVHSRDSTARLLLFLKNEGLGGKSLHLCISSAAPFHHRGLGSQIEVPSESGST